MPKPNREVIEREEEIFNYLKESHISAKNIARLSTLAASDDPGIAELAAVAIEVAEVKPFKKRRLKVLARERRDLLDLDDPDRHRFPRFAGQRVRMAEATEAVCDRAPCAVVRLVYERLAFDAEGRLDRAAFIRQNAARAELAITQCCVSTG